MKNTTLLLLFILATFSCKNVQISDDKFINETLHNFSINLNDSKEKALSFVEQTDSLLSTKDNNIYKGINNFIKGSYFNTASNYELALKFLNEVEPYLQNNTKYDSLVLAAYLLKCNVYANQGNYTEGVNAALHAKTGFEEMNNNAGIYASNISMAKIYQAKGELGKAEEYLKMVNDSNSKRITLKAKHLLANIYGEQGKIAAALNIDNKVIAENKENNSPELSPFYNNKALCLNELKLFDSAIFYFKKSLSIDSIAGSLQNIAANYNDMGETYLNRNDFENSLYYTNKALVISKSIGKKITELYSYKNLFNLYRKKNDFQTALLYSDTIKQVQKILDNVALNTKIEELNLVYETAKKEKKIEEQHNEIKNRNLYIIGSVILLFLATLVGYSFTKKQKLKQELERILLAQQNEKAILAASEFERLRISRDLHDNMGAYTTALIANVDSLKQKHQNETELGKMKNNAEQILSSLRETIWVLNNKEINVVDFSDAFTSYCFKILQSFNNINFEVVEDIQHAKILQAKVAIHLNKILQELFQNCIKHSQGNLIKYKIISNEKIIVELKDNGIGYNYNEVVKGNGLENIMWRAAQIGAQVSVALNPTGGTSVILILDL